MRSALNKRKVGERPTLMSRQATQTQPNSAKKDVAIARSAFLDESLQKANQLALSQHHAGVSSEHLLFALSEDPEALVVLGASTVDIDRLRGDITTHLGQLPRDTAAGKAALPTADLLKVLKLAAMAAQQSARRQIDGAIVLAAIIGDASTPSAGLLRAHGLTFNEVIRVLQKSSAPAAPVPSPLAANGATAQPPAAPTIAAPVTAPTAPIAPTAPNAHVAARAAASARPSTDELLASVRARLQESAPPPPRRIDKPTERIVATTDESDRSALAQSRPDAARSDAARVGSELDQERRDAVVPSIASKSSDHSSDDTDDTDDRGIAATSPRAQAAAPPADKSPHSEMTAVSHAATQVRRDGDATLDRQQRATPADDGPHTPDDLLRPKQPWPTLQPIGSSAPVKAASTVPTDDAAATLQPPLPLVPTTAPRGVPPPLPLPSVSASLPSQPRATMASMQPAAGVVRLPPVPPPSVDMRSLVAAFPRRLRQGQTDVVEIVVPRRALEIPHDPGHRWPPLRVATMRLRAASDDAHVQLASPETLWISPPRVHQGADDATWRWRVTPRNKGRIKLSLSGATRIVGSEGITAEIPLGEESIEIDVARRGSRRGLVGLLVFGNLIALGVLAMIMSGRATELVLWGWAALCRLVGLA